MFWVLLWNSFLHGPLTHSAFSWTFGAWMKSAWFSLETVKRGVGQWSVLLPCPDSPLPPSLLLLLGHVTPLRFQLQKEIIDGPAQRHSWQNKTESTVLFSHLHQSAKFLMTVFVSSRPLVPHDKKCVNFPVGEILVPLDWSHLVQLGQSCCTGSTWSSWAGPVGLVPPGPGPAGVYVDFHISNFSNSSVVAMNQSNNPLDGRQMSWKLRHVTQPWRVWTGSSAALLTYIEVRSCVRRAQSQLLTGCWPRWKCSF